MNTLEQLEQQLHDEKLKVERRDAILRLTNNADFKKVIREGFMVEDCARYARESINPMLTPDERANALAFAQAAGYLKQFLNIAIQMGDSAVETVSRCEDAIDQVRAEEIEEDNG